MVIAGRVENGVVVVDDAASLPEGAQVAVVVPGALALEAEPVSEGDHQRRLAIIDRIAALPIEGATDPFSGREHDRVLYGKP